MEKQKMIKDDTKEFQRKEEQKKVEYVGLSRIEPWAKGFQVERFIGALCAEIVTKLYHCVSTS